MTTKCKQCNYNGHSGQCTLCGGSGKVPAVSEFMAAVRTAAGNHLLTANQCLTWLQDLARR